MGRKNNPSFRFVVTDSQNATRSGKFLEVLGSFDYRNGGADQINADRVKHWISVGAKPTDNVHNYLIGKKILTGKKIDVNPRKSPPKAEVAPAEAKKAEAAPEAAAPAEAKAEAPAPVAETPAPTEAPKA